MLVSLRAHFVLEMERKIIRRIKRKIGFAAIRVTIRTTW